ncbi:hypothetical protein M513_07270 [Trichuris suis]|uniref:Uncharacterized protein n=1 Tax=Trichuris suis TaxID=68888 RepID=A0A085M3Z5_9BILA|nr:hypothetical protein M513_07270 [Trichuris suis]
MVSGSKLDSNRRRTPHAAASITLLGFLEETTLVNPLSTEPIKLCRTCNSTWAADTSNGPRDELGKLDQWPQINGNEPMEMDLKG